MMSVFVLKKDSPGYFFKQRIWFKPIGILPVMARTFLFCIILNILISNFHAVPEEVNKTLKLLALALSAGGLLSLLLIIYFSAFLLNLVVPNDLIPWAEVSP